MNRLLVVRIIGSVLVVGIAAACAQVLSPKEQRVIAQVETTEADPPEVAIGERLFLETRFAQFFFANSKGNANATLKVGDPVMAVLRTPKGPVRSPFAGQSMNCRQCHLVDEVAETAGYRTYGDFAVRSPIPNRGDGLTTTPRNSPPMMNLALNTSAGEVYHYDGEFPNLEELVKGSFTGRNFGWLATEQQSAIQHIASIIRNDNGRGALAKEFGGAYALVLAGKSSDPNFVLPPEYRLNVKTATDAEIIEVVARLVAAYVDSLTLAQDEEGNFKGSPYDAFLAKNNLPLKPQENESDLAYSQRLALQLSQLSSPKFITPRDGRFALNRQPYLFGPQQLAGLKIFLTQPDANTPLSSGVGNCLACHAAPTFTNFSLRNTGVSQQEYDGIHGEGTFNALPIPSLTERNRNYDAYLPATSVHPTAQGPFRRPATPENPSFTDLGAWNSYLNPDFVTPPEKIEYAMGLTTVPASNQQQVLEQAIARFKVPGLRDLGDSAPYFHNGSKADLKDVVLFYQEFSAKARQNQVRNVDPEVANIFLSDADLKPLTAFLKSLKEDYKLTKIGVQNPAPLKIIN